MRAPWAGSRVVKKRISGAWYALTALPWLVAIAVLYVNVPRVIHGFTHQHQMRSEGESLVINPGEACGWLFGAPTAAILDLDTKHVEFIKLDGAEWKT